MMKKKIIGLLLFPLTVLLAFFLVQEATVHATEHADVVTKMYFTDKDGNPLTPPDIHQWEQFRINVDFELHNNEVSAGDTTVLQLPDVITFASNLSFDLKDDAGNVVAKADINSRTKQVTITYQPYVETHSDVKGIFYFYVRMNHDVITTPQEVPIEIAVNGKLIPAGNINFQGIGQPWKSDLSKVGWQDSAEPTIGHYYIAVNRSGKAMPQGKIVDTLRNPGVVYIKDSFQIYKGIWVFRNGGWNLDNAVNITDQAQVIFENNSFSIQLPDLADYEGVGISYKVQLPSAPNDGDQFLNSATLTTSNNIEVTHNSGYTFYQGGGKAEGHVFKLQIKKVSEDGSVLKGAKFDVIRDRSGGVVAQVETNENGIAEIENLLKDNYTIKETQAPNGYELTESVHVTPADFDSTLKLATKLIVNKKITTTTTVAPATTTTAEATTSTVAPATTTTAEATTTTVAPTTVESPTTTTVAKTTTTVNVPGTTSVTPPPAGKKGKTLPKTGEESGLTTSLVGFALMTVAGVAGVLYRKSKRV